MWILAPLLVALAPDVRLPGILADHMVLQRETESALWGQADPGELVAVKASWGATAETQADDEGRWRVALQTPEAGGPYLIEVKGATKTRRIEDVWIGEVWICSGQSNMEWSVAPGYVGSGIADWEAIVAAADHPTLRLFDLERAIEPGPVEDCGGEWKPCTPENAPAFSATAYLFGLELQRELHVPIGLVSTNWGGTVAEAWTSREGLAGFPEFNPDLERLGAIAADPEGARTRLEQGWRDWWSALEEKDPLSRDGRWRKARFALDSSWGTMALPALWEPELGNFDGLVWFVREFDLPSGYEGKDLLIELGPIDDMDSTWLNGVKIGGMEEEGRHQTPRGYRAPATLLRPEHNLLAVRALDTGGAGGFGGRPQDMRMGPFDSQARTSLAGEWRYHLGASMGELGNPPSRSWMHPNLPTVLYNGMIAPILPLRFRGVIWYQGESNRGRAAQYRRLFPTLIADWRRAFGQGDFPFYYVQIAPFGYGGDQGEAAELREAQTLTLSVPNTGMAVTMDIGDPGDIHPKNKQDVGRRLALWALARDYGRADIDPCGPLLKETRREGAALRLSFEHGEGLTSHGEPLEHFAVAGSDRVFHPARAVIEGQTIKVESAEVPEPVAVRFAWGAADITRLWNGAGLPAPSFRSDDW